MGLEIMGLPIEIKRKNIKNLHLAVLPPDGHVRVSVPIRMTDESVELFVRLKWQWVKNKRQKFIDQPRQLKRQYVPGETMYVLGKQYFLQVDYSYKGNSLELSGNTAKLVVRKESTPQQRINYVNECYRGILKKEIVKYLPKWEEITGLYCDSWQTKNMRTRWGTCNPNTKKLWFNLQLAKKPPECIEYVILHELAHLRIKNHSSESKAIMDKYMLNWEEIRNKLNVNT